MVLKAECSVDDPGEITWTLGRPREVLGPCPHTECRHEIGTQVASGPDRERYTLDSCDVLDGCDGDCRAWHDWASRPVSPWLHVGAVTS